jgi:hypothetical protein
MRGYPLIKKVAVFILYTTIKKCKNTSSRIFRPTLSNLALRKKSFMVKGGSEGGEIHKKGER